MELTCTAQAPSATHALPADNRRERLRSFLEAYWLRPENALWMTLRSLTLASCPLPEPSADLACGDGVFTFLHHGGRFAEAFDVFCAVGHLDQVVSRNADMFDAAGDGYFPVIARRAARRIGLGADLKAELLKKAARLELYDELIRCDANEPLPLADQSLASVYCNSAYWIGRIERFLRELHRVVRAGGQIVLHVKLSDMHAWTLERFERQLGRRFLDIIDRGRWGCWPTVAPRAEWERRFARAGLEIVDVRPLASSTHAHVWDVGLRPLAPLLVRLANGVSPADRLAIKRDWVALMLELAEPLCRCDLDLVEDGAAPAELQYVLTPR